MPPSNDKSSKFSHLPLTTSGPQDCAISGTALLNTPYFNKGSAFPADERVDFNLTGLLPHNVQTLEQQVQRAYQQYSEQQGDLAKNTFMTSMRDQNEVLFYRVCLLWLMSQYIWNHMIPDFNPHSCNQSYFNNFYEVGFFVKPNSYFCLISYHSLAAISPPYKSNNL
jgi:hypothetical protein